MPPVRILHFADAHIDMANYGRHDPESGLPVRVVDFLNALDQIVDFALDEPVDLVLFAGDAYKDRNPHPTFQREWGRRMMRLSAAGIPTVLLVGNHDVSPASGRAHTLQEYSTLNVPHVFVADSFQLLGPAELGVPLQIVTVPWLSRSQLLKRDELLELNHEDFLTEMESRVEEVVTGMIESADPELPLVLTAHASVQGAKFGSERAVMLGQELVLGGRLVRHPRLDYVALGHIHQHQDLNEGDRPPIVYPGSIERVDFGEMSETKGFVVAEVRQGQCDWRFIPLKTRRFLNYRVEPESADNFMTDVLAQLPEPAEVADAICRVQLTYPRDWETMIDEAAIAERFAEALSFQLQKVRQSERRARLGEDSGLDALGPLDLLETYWQTVEMEPAEAEKLQTLAAEILFREDE